MKIVIIRHEKVDMAWDKSYDSVSYDLACCAYDRCSIQARGRQLPDIDNTRVIYVSELSRTYETACRLFGKREFRKTSLINEVPLRSFTDTTRKYPLWFWNFMGRLQWLLQNERQAEGKKDTLLRAAKMTSLLEKRNEDCTVITHGFYMLSFIRVLKKRGYKIKRDSRFGMKNLERMVAVKAV